MEATTIHAPDFPKGLDWIGTRAPLDLAAVRGNVVILHFWTFC